MWNSTWKVPFSISIILDVIFDIGCYNPSPVSSLMAPHPAFNPDLAPAPCEQQSGDITVCHHLWATHICWHKQRHNSVGPHLGVTHILLAQTVPWLVTCIYSHLLPHISKRSIRGKYKLTYLFEKCNEVPPPSLQNNTFICRLKTMLVFCLRHNALSSLVADTEDDNSEPSSVRGYP